MRHCFLFHQRLKIGSYEIRYFHWVYIPLVKWGQQKVPSFLPVGNDAGRHKPSSPARWSYWLLFSHLELSSPLLLFKALPVPEVQFKLLFLHKIFLHWIPHRDLSQLITTIMISVLLIGACHWYSLLSFTGMSPPF